jgi:hypothetical protein
LSQGGAELSKVSLDVDKGFNYADYDLSITEAGKNALMKEDTSVNINKAQNGIYYLPKGTYTIQIGTEKTPLVIK